MKIGRMVVIDTLMTLVLIAKDHTRGKIVLILPGADCAHNIKPLSGVFVISVVIKMVIGIIVLICFFLPQTLDMMILLFVMTSIGIWKWKKLSMVKMESLSSC